MRPNRQVREVVFAEVAIGRPGCKVDSMDGSFDDVFEKMGLDRAERHIFLCIGPDCCGSEQGQRMWQTVKKAIKAHDLPILRSKAGCLRICRGGPWMVVYPEGTWYGRLTPERFDRILKEHLIGGKPVEAWVAARRPLPPSVA